MFKVGCVYRQKNGEVVQLFDTVFEHGPESVREGEAHARPPISERRCGLGFRRLADGSDPSGFAKGARHLVPGELHQVNGEWVPVEDKASLCAELLKLMGTPVEEKAFCDALARDAAADYAKSKRDPLPGWTKDRPDFDPFHGLYDGVVVLKSKSQAPAVQTSAPLPKGATLHVHWSDLHD
jgi:hypothetical protein